MKSPFENSPLALALFGSTRSSLFWLLVRLYVGSEWLSAGLEKLGDSVWTGGQAGQALGGFLKGSLAKTAGPHPDVMNWYAWFIKTLVLSHPALWSYAVAWGETLVGFALIVGLFTGIAAFFGVFMNLNYLMAGTVSTNPILLTLGVGLILAWRVAGYFGLDRFALPILGTPWQPGRIFKKDGGV